MAAHLHICGSNSVSFIHFELSFGVEAAESHSQHKLLAKNRSHKILNLICSQGLTKTDTTSTVSKFRGCILSKADYVTTMHGRLSKLEASNHGPLMRPTFTLI